MEDTTKTTNTVTKPARFQIAGELEGFPFTVTFRGKADVLKATVAKLKEAGATAPRAGVSAVATAGNADAVTGPPKCPRHNAKMKESRKPGVWFCPKKDGDDYCEHKVNQ